MEVDLKQFIKQVEEFSTKAFGAVDKVFQEVVVDLGQSVVTLSPVLTGRFKGNWQLTVGSPANFSLLTTDPEGDNTMTKIRQQAATLQSGQIAWLANQLTYGPLIETGDHSPKAPQGVVGITAVKFLAMVEDARQRHAV